MYYSEYGGIYFIEGRVEGANRIDKISTELNGFFSQNQLRTLNDLKEKMRAYVISKGGNCVLDFKYGQRSTYWKSLIGMDDVLWYGSGEIAIIDKSALNNYHKA